MLVGHRESIFVYVVLGVGPEGWRSLEPGTYRQGEHTNTLAQGFQPATHLLPGSK